MCGREGAAPDKKQDGASYGRVAVLARDFNMDLPDKYNTLPGFDTTIF